MSSMENTLIFSESDELTSDSESEEDFNEMMKSIDEFVLCFAKVKEEIKKLTDENHELKEENEKLISTIEKIMPLHQKFHDDIQEVLRSIRKELQLEPSSEDADPQIPVMPPDDLLHSDQPGPAPEDHDPQVPLKDDTERPCETMECAEENPVNKMLSGEKEADTYKSPASPQNSGKTNDCEAASTSSESKQHKEKTLKLKKGEKHKCYFPEHKQIFRNVYFPVVNTRTQRRAWRVCYSIKKGRKIVSIGSATRMRATMKNKRISVADPKNAYLLNFNAKICVCP